MSRPTVNGPANCSTTRQVVDRIMMQYMIMLIYFLPAVSNKKPAKSPLSASSTLAHCPMFATPLAWYRVTALSSVLKMQVIIATKRARMIPIFMLLLPIFSVSSCGASFEKAGTMLLFSARISITASSRIKADRITASKISV